MLGAVNLQLCAIINCHFQKEIKGPAGLLPPWFPCRAHGLGSSTVDLLQQGQVKFNFLQRQA